VAVLTVYVRFLVSLCVQDLSAERQCTSASVSWWTVSRLFCFTVEHHSALIPETVALQPWRSLLQTTFTQSLVTRRWFHKCTHYSRLVQYTQLFVVHSQYI